ncbi:hypothetical protein DI43_07450 [Geobacillus sp. CAMR12739]|nr:hypothetical protein DI43_07450 [Geobacillus sp. CAMR12739]
MGCGRCTASNEKRKLRRLASAQKQAGVYCPSAPFGVTRRMCSPPCSRIAFCLVVDELVFGQRRKKVFGF